ncbi:MAG: excinuclease ABC subunit UvrA [Planctomycetes bacterium]|nr:excinuclease ABC subunit UvrA [Planctomycetota bacterium]
MPASDVIIKGAREHNLRNVDLVLPRNKLICLTGVSGSGKSSLAFDTLYAEGQRRYIESLSTFARQFLGQLPKPDADLIAGLSPSISISQKSSGNNPRSTVGTITEIYDYLRVLMARVGTGHCPECRREITAQTREQILVSILQLPSGTSFSVLAPLIRGQKGEHRDLFSDLLKQGFVRARVDGQVVSLRDDLGLDRQMRHDIELVVDRLVAKGEIRGRLADSVDLALRIGNGNLIISCESDAPSAQSAPGAADGPTRVGADAIGSTLDDELESGLEGRKSGVGDPGVPDRERARSGRRRRTASSATRSGDIVYSISYACTHCQKSFEPPSPQLFSFNSPQGMCGTCDGLGTLFSFDPARLITEPGKSFRDGCVLTIGPWKDLGRWRRHIYQGVADTMERKSQLPANYLLDTPWSDLTAAQRNWWLWGTGSEHITFTWRGGSSPIKYGGKFDGIIPDLRERHRTSKSPPQIRQLESYMTTGPCPACHGLRLNAQAAAVRIRTAAVRFQAENRSYLTLPEICELSVAEACEFFQQLELDSTRTLIASEVLKEIRARLGFLLNVGLDYLTLARTAPTLSGGESQRIRLASQIGSGLVGVLYILDEPSIGLHPRDNDRLLHTLRMLRDMGNTVVVVEHDEETMRAADHLIDFGPGPGVRGGEIVASGPAIAIAGEPRSVTGKYLSGALRIEIPVERRSPSDRWLRVLGARHNNLRNVDIEIPLGAFVCVTGVSGSGKSSLVNDILVEALRRDLNGGEGEPGEFREMLGLQHLDKLIAIDQSPIGRTPRSNPGTYIKVFDAIRDMFTQLPEAKQRGFKPGRFSFNVEGGRCEACEGNGSNRLEMDFLADVWVTCPVCEGRRFNRETLQVKFKEKSITDILEMDVQQALELFENVPQVRQKLQTLHDVGLDYIKIGQPSPTLSGGEAQRIKLARELTKRSTGKTLYLLDEPTTGLHFADIQLLLKVLHGFVDAGNTVLVVEHNLDVIKTADWIIDLGPEGGSGGGEVVAVGTPEQIMQVPRSHTGQSLTRHLQPRTFADSVGVTSDSTSAGNRGAGVGRGRKRTKAAPAAAQAAPGPAPGFLATEISVRGARQHNLQGIDVTIPRDRMTVFCGPSGSGKSSLAMDTIYAEGQRRYVESLSSYARQFVAQMQKPQLEHIEGLSPAIAIEQKNLGHTPRSTVGTVTEIYDYLRILFARLGVSHCPDCDQPIGTQTADEIIDKVLRYPEGTRLYLMAPSTVVVGQEYASLWDELRSSGYVRVRIDGQTYSLDALPAIDRRRQHRVEVVVDRIVVQPNQRRRLADSIENTLALGKGVLHLALVDEKLPESRWETAVHSQHLACDRCGKSYEPLTPHSFSFNSPLGWCPACNGLGVQVGANLAALVRDPKLTLDQGALDLWPNLSRPIGAAMLQAFSEGSGIPTNVPFQELNARQRRWLLHGTADIWFSVSPPAGDFQFQFKGLYPALEEASRINPSLRMRLESFVGEVECSNCGGSRLRPDAAAARFRDRTLDEICRMPLAALRAEIARWNLNVRDRRIAGELLREITGRLQFLLDVGLEYLSLSRPAATLSNGEAQRIRLASQLGSGLCGVLYVLDEPTIGLHPRDNRRLLAALHKLRDLGNTLLVVEHDREVIEQCDALCDFGPGAGKHGGRIVAHGPPDQVKLELESVTGPYLSGRKSLPIPSNRRIGSADSRRHNWVEILGARHNNLRNIDVRIPLATLTAVTGPSGSGKSSLIEDVLYAAIARRLHRAARNPGLHTEIRGLEYINKVIQVDQQPLGNSPSSNPATYTGVFDDIRELFAQLPEAKLRGYSPRRFSFNVPGGRCEACEGNGQKRIEMHFLPDIWVECDACRGKRYHAEVLQVAFHGKSISDVLEMTCGEARELFQNIPAIRRKLTTLCDVGLDYLTLGQAAPTLSGGEAQRVKLAAELSRPDTGRTLYLLDEPTTGLHFSDIAKLLEVLQRLVDLGNTVVVIEHNLDVIKQCDWIVDLGPEAGAGGGQIVAQGTPEQVVKQAKAARKAARTGDEPIRSHTGEALAEPLKAGPYLPREPYKPLLETQPGDMEIKELGKDAKMPWELDGRGWHTRDRVGRKGEPCKWDGRILAEVVDRIQQLGQFAPTDWTERSVVEIRRKDLDGWFFHAITGEAWLLKMKFRVARGTFKQQELQERVKLKTLNELHELPIYGNEPRVKYKSIGGPWQEAEIRAHTFEEIDTPEFWSFLEESVHGYCKVAERQAAMRGHHLPWQALGIKWHFMRKGFPDGRTVEWDDHLLEKLHALLQQVAPHAEFVWGNRTFYKCNIERDLPSWAIVYTKNPTALTLMLRSRKNQVPLGAITGFGCEQQVDGSSPNEDLVYIRFRSLDDLRRGDLPDFLKKHAADFRAAASHFRAV